MFVQRIYHQALAQASYMVGCQATGEAVVIDPHRHIEEYLILAEREGLRITAVTETHIHADFVSGSRELAQQAGAQLYLSHAGPADWAYAFAEQDNARLLGNGDSFWIGNIRLEARHTPGHTPEHLAFLVTDTPATDQPLAIVTGDAVFVGDVGRPDLLEKAAGMKGTTEAGARQLFQTIQWFKTLPEYLQIWPGHGAGSACGRALGAVPQSTLGYEARANWAFQIDAATPFVAAVLEDQPAPPPYFAHMKQINKAGPAPRPRTLPSLLSVETLAELREQNSLVIDVRSPDLYARGHITGSLNLPAGGSMLTWAGWLVPYDRPLVLLVDTEQLDAVRDELGLIGLDQIVGYAPPEIITEWRARGYPVAQISHRNAAEVQELVRDQAATIIDVRNPGEYALGHLPGSQNIPLAQLSSQAGTISHDQPVLVHCQSGGRSPMAASLLTGAGVANVIEMRDGFAGWQQATRAVEQQKGA